ncbi:MAG: serine--tRNA ligase [Nitrospirae bacterium]|nr:serine--tRNA ligase [Nitrospirota bacterium]
MLDARFIFENLEAVKARMARRGGECDWGRFQELYQKRRELVPKADAMRNRRKTMSEQIGKARGKGEGIEEKKAEVRKLGEEIAAIEKEVVLAEAALRDWLLLIPNLPSDGVPDGKTAQDNRLVRESGAKPSFNFKPRAHWDIGETLGILDFERAAKLSGSRFVVYRGAAARMERALINFMLDTQTRENGYEEILPPSLVGREIMVGTGQLPKFAEDMFKVEGWDHYLVPTAEVPLTNLHRDEILEEERLPLKYAAYTPCFRKEAGSHGKDVKGIIRQHQFNKIEIVKFATPEQSYSELESLTTDAESILQKLGLPYRVMELCAGDLGFSAARTYDLEVWLPGEGGYKEISSCSNCEAFQARRANIRYRRSKDKKLDFVHTLNGSGLAVGRTLVAVLENHQQSDGTVVVPEALRPYMGGMNHIS